ncbi:MAG: rhomboid family intramembrane serine protease, partial [Rhodoferax sp.]|uniref:rhomboid family intramembrane serine protease n=1 Tax=Rhodoferax sp. TaxID=50421 RepID=UPI001B47AD49
QLPAHVDNVPLALKGQHVTHKRTTAWISPHPAPRTQKSGHSLLTVPFLHANTPHFLGNLTLLAFIMPIVAALVGARGAIAVMLMGCFAGAYAQMWLGSDGDAHVGASAGILGLYAYITSLSLLRKISLPKGFVWAIASVAMATVLGAGVFSNNVANAAHLMGLLIGVFWSLLDIRTRSTKKGY